jgi:hypothetical protein
MLIFTKRIIFPPLEGDKGGGLFSWYRRFGIFLIKNSALKVGHHEEAASSLRWSIFKSGTPITKTGTELFATFLRKKSREIKFFTFF